MHLSASLVLQAFRRPVFRFSLTSRCQHLSAPLSGNEVVSITWDMTVRPIQQLFTTKQNGTGLGLSIVKGIVELHGGKIFLESDVNEGCFFKLIFPGRNT